MICDPAQTQFVYHLNYFYAVPCKQILSNVSGNGNENSWWKLYNYQIDYSLFHKGLELRFLLIIFLFVNVFLKITSQNDPESKLQLSAIKYFYI